MTRQQHDHIDAMLIAALPVLEPILKAMEEVKGERHLLYHELDCIVQYGLAKLSERSQRE